MRNLEASEWLGNPTVDIIETKGSTDAGAEFSLSVPQENPQAPPADGAGE
jgi:hypothetical protein